MRHRFSKDGFEQKRIGSTPCARPSQTRGAQSAYPKQAPEGSRPRSASTRTGAFLSTALIPLGALLGAACGDEDPPVTVTGVEIEVDFNTLPEVQDVRATPSHIRFGESTTLEAVVDDDGNSLLYAWSAACDGRFDDPSAASPQFTLDSEAESSCAITVTATDESGATGSGSITIVTGLGHNGVWPMVSNFQKDILRNASGAGTDDRNQNGLALDSDDATCLGTSTGSVERAFEAEGDTEAFLRLNYNLRDPAGACTAFAAYFFPLALPPTRNLQSMLGVEFRVRGQNGGERLRVELRSAEPDSCLGTFNRFTSFSVFATTEWRTVEVPFVFFQSANFRCPFNRLDTGTVAIKVESLGQGGIELDDIKFIEPPVPGTED